MQRELILTLLLVQSPLSSDHDHHHQKSLSKSLEKLFLANTCLSRGEQLPLVVPARHARPAD